MSTEDGTPKSENLPAVVATPPVASTRADEARAIIVQHVVVIAGLGLVPGGTAWALGGGIAIDGVMMARLARLYGHELKAADGRAWLAVLFSNFGGVLLAAAIVGVSALLPRGGGLFNGVAQPLSMAVFTYALGRVFVQHLERGGGVPDFDPVNEIKALRHFMREGRAVVRERIRRTRANATAS